MMFEAAMQNGRKCNLEDVLLQGYVRFKVKHSNTCYKAFEL